MPTKAKPKDVLEELFAKAGKNGLRVGSMADTASDTLWLSTGNLAIDAAFGGGIPMGRHTELYGRESSGIRSAASRPTTSSSIWTTRTPWTRPTPRRWGSM